MSTKRVDPVHILISVILLAWAFVVSIKTFHCIPPERANKDAMASHKKGYDDGWNAGVSWKLQTDSKILDEAYSVVTTSSTQPTASHALAEVSAAVKKKVSP